MYLKKIIPAIALSWGLFLLLFTSAEASHIRAGDITAVRTGTLTYCFRVTIYTDDASSADSPFLDIDFGDNTALGRINRCGNKIPLGNATSVGYYGFGATGCSFCHTFPGAGIYVISFTEENRQGGVRNMSNSLGTPFSINVVIDINPSFGANTSPILTIPPIDRGCVGQRFFHNPGAYDVDGDSLVFRLATPRRSRLENVVGYQSPDFYGGTVEGGTAPATFTMNPRTGDLVWDAVAPIAATYNVAFIVEEWRNGIKIGQATRDMQIITEDCTNKRPRLTVTDICVVADDDITTNTNIIQREITATDPDTAPQDNLIISSDQVQQVYSAFNIKANFTFSPTPQVSTARANFTWDTRAEHVQRQPYIVVFKVKDFPLLPRKIDLADIKSMLITVKGTPVRNVAAVPTGKQINLAWNDYKTLCPTFTAAQFAGMEYVIWRREGCGTTIPCTQNPSQVGYTPIGNLNLNATSFIDNGALKPGLSYSYVITVKYPAPREGESQASIEVCASLPLLSPILTKASVKSTNTTAINGEVEVSWLRAKPTLPIANFNTQFVAPYKYQLYRAEGFSSNVFTLIHTVNDATGNTINFDFTDTGLDTKGKTYLYKVAWYTSATETRMLDSDSSSTVRLTATPALNSIALTWNYNTTWSNQNQVHEVFRAEEGIPKAAYVKIGEVLVGTRKFVDDGTFGNICLDPLKVYGYYVKTKGSYSNADIPEPVGLLRNDSQQAYASPLDNTPPAPPILKIDSTKCPTKPDCSTPILPTIPKNALSWQSVKSGNKCQDFIATYRLYFKPAGKEDFVLLGNPPFPQPYLDTFYVHTDLPQIRPGVLSQAGCYYVTAVDQQGNESTASNIVCKDNCLYFQLPNVFTPDNDGKNDTFRACPTPQFVEKVIFSVYDRWGGLVYRGDTDVEVNWNGKNQQGQDVPATTYYYEAKVTFVTIEDSKRVQLLKGWINLIR